MLETRKVAASQCSWETANLYHNFWQTKDKRIQTTFKNEFDRYDSAYTQRIPYLLEIFRMFIKTNYILDTSVNAKCGNS